MNLQLKTCMDAQPCDLASWWQAAPQNAACMILTLRKLSVFPTKPKGIDLEAALEGRLFWPEGELRWRRYDAFDGQQRRDHLHVVVAGSWMRDHRLSGAIQLTGGIPIPGPLIWEKRTVGDREIFSAQEHSDRQPPKINIKLWFDDRDHGYFQWCGLDEKEEKHVR